MEPPPHSAPVSIGSSANGSQKSRTQKGRGRKFFGASSPQELGEDDSNSPPPASVPADAIRPRRGSPTKAAHRVPAPAARAVLHGSLDDIEDDDSAASSAVDLSQARKLSNRKPRLGRAVVHTPRKGDGAGFEGPSSFPPARPAASPRRGGGGDNGKQMSKSPTKTGASPSSRGGKPASMGSSPRRRAASSGVNPTEDFDDAEEVARPGLGFVPRQQTSRATPPRDSTPNGTPTRGGRGGGFGGRGQSPGFRGGMSPRGGGTPQSGAQPRNHKDRYQEHLTPEQVEAGLAAGTLHKGVLRINAHNNREAYVSVPGFNKDVYIDGLINRNRAFEGDTVVVELVDRKFWRLAKGIKEEAERLLEEGLERPSPEAEAEAHKVVAAVPPAEQKRELEELVELGVFTPSVTAPIAAAAAELDEGEEEEEEGEEVSEIVDDSYVTPESQLLLGVSGDIPAPPEPLEAQMSTLTISKSTSGTPSSLKKPNGRSRAVPDNSHRPDDELQPAGKVVAVVESGHLKEQIGVVRPISGTRVRPNDRVAEFTPMDPRMPRILVPISQIPDFYKEPQLYARKLVVVELQAWPVHSFLPFGKYMQILGEAGEIPTETETLLRLTRVDYRDFRKEVLESLPQGEFVIPEAEIARRRDFRKTRLFTIDPITAKDLDDALSITRLPDGNFEVGVHIADVSFFVHAGTLLDVEAQRRSTSVYLVQKVIPMLPQLLCENLCSLNPAVDRLAFSVVWTLTPAGDIVNEWFGRTVIRSCAKLPYEVAQLVIDGKVRSQKDWAEAGIDGLYKNVTPVDGHTIDGVIEDILNLQSIAVPLRRARFQGGSLTITNVKLSFLLDEKGNPYDTWTYITKEANWLVEEFMLLANRRVAQKIASALPDCALLRCHPPPVRDKLQAFGKFCQDLQISIDTSSGKALAESLKKIQPTTPPDIFQLLQIMLVRPMQLAKYFCTGDLEIEAWPHYALNMDRYTHFTSPIRRYPDVVVHRQLQAALCLEQAEKQQIDVFELENVMQTLPEADRLVAICEHANEKKLNARKARELSDKLYLCLMLKDKPVVTDAMVVGLGDKFITVILPKYGLERRLYMEDIGTKSHEYEPIPNTLTLTWPSFARYCQLPGRAPPALVVPEPSPTVEDVPVVQKINILTTFKVLLRMDPERVPIDLDDMMLHPADPRCRQ